MGFEGSLSVGSQSLLCCARAIDYLGVYLRNHRYCFPLLYQSQSFCLVFSLALALPPTSRAGVDTTLTGSGPHALGGGGQVNHCPSARSGGRLAFLFPRVGEVGPGIRRGRGPVGGGWAADALGPGQWLSVVRSPGPTRGAVSLPVPPSLTFFKATNSFSAQGRRESSSSYLVDGQEEIF